MTPDPRYPLGRFNYAGPSAAAERAEQIDRIATLPDRLESTLAKLDPAAWETPYRPGGWTVRQVVHHLPDSHLHAYGRFMFALAQDGVTIRPYDEVQWVAVAEEKRLEPMLSVDLLRALHARWAALLRTLEGDDFRRAIHHPEHDRSISVDELLGMYAWHGDHHLAHIESVRNR